MKRLARHLRAHPQLLAAVVTGVAVAWLMPGLPRSTERVIVGWNVGAWLYLLLVGAMMWRADQGQLKRVAVAHAEGATVALSIVIAASLCTVIALVLELTAIKAQGLGDIPLVVGGIIPPEDENTLKQCGVAAVFTPKDYELNRILSDIVRVVDDRADKAA